MSGPDELAKANEPWDGRWFVPLPGDDGGPRGWTIDQFTALQILRGRLGLTNWAAKFLQTVLLQEEPPSDLQRHWLERLSREHDERLAA